VEATGTLLATLGVLVRRSPHAATSAVVMPAQAGIQYAAAVGIATSASACWIARSSRAMTVEFVGAALLPWWMQQILSFTPAR
jgi:hypothetical protein